MGYAYTILQQVIVMFILAFAGYVLFKKGKISQEGSKAIANILIYLSLPCVIINGFLVERTTENMKGLGISAIMALIALLASILISRIVMGKNAIENFAGAFSNPGFFGIPIIMASISQSAVFYIAAYIAYINLGQWTYGVGMLVAEKEGAKGNPFKGILKKLFTAPFMVGIVIGLFFFFSGLSMPSIPLKCVTFLANCNTPLAMFTIGIYLAQTDIAQTFKKWRLYLLSAVRLVFSPLVAMALLTLLPNDYFELKMAVLIGTACPVGSNVAVYAQLYDSDYSYAVETVVVSTLLSIVTMPAIVALATYLWC